jgi:hypothetical protein
MFSGSSCHRLIMCMYIKQPVRRGQVADALSRTETVRRGLACEAFVGSPWVVIDASINHVNQSELHPGERRLTAKSCV